jgi:hypothetical protein
MVMNEKSPFLTVEDLILASLPKFGGSIVKTPLIERVEKLLNRQTLTNTPNFFVPIPMNNSTSNTTNQNKNSSPNLKNQNGNSSTNSANQTANPVSTSPFGNMTFDEAFTRLRMIWASIPAKNRQMMLPVLVERLSRRIADPMEREDFRTIAMSLEEIQQNDDVIQKYLPIILILSLMRGG